MAEEPVALPTERAVGARGEPRARSVPATEAKKRRRRQRQRRALRRSGVASPGPGGGTAGPLGLQGRDAEEIQLAKRKRKNWRRRQALRRQAEPQALDRLTWQVEAPGLVAAKGRSVPLEQRRAELKALRAAERRQQQRKRRKGQRQQKAVG